MLKIWKYIQLLLQQFSLSVLQVFASRHNAHMFRYCPSKLNDNPLLTHRTTLSPSFSSQSSEDVFMLFSTDCVSGQEATWFLYCFAWMIADYRPLWMWGFVPCFGPSVLQLSSHSQTRRRWWWLSLPIALCQLGNQPLRSCISLLLLDSTEPRLHRVINSMNLACRKEMSWNCIIPVKTPGYP